MIEKRITQTQNCPSPLSVCQCVHMCVCVCVYVCVCVCARAHIFHIVMLEPFLTTTSCVSFLLNC